MNVILVDFRGFDTFGEIIVLGIAALVIYALTEALLSGPVRARLLNRVPDKPLAGDRHPLMMVVLTRVMMPIVLMVGVYIFLRGHNQPGGGFIAGLVVAVAVVMQYLASGFAWATDRQRYPYHAIIGSGVLAAGLTGIGAWFAGREFLTSARLREVARSRGLRGRLGALLRSGRLPGRGRRGHALARELLAACTPVRYARSGASDGYRPVTGPTRRGRGLTWN